MSKQKRDREGSMKGKPATVSVASQDDGKEPFQEKHIKNKMIVDSGAQERVVSGICLFQSLEEVENGNGELPNGLRITAKQRRKLIADTGLSTIILCKVYYIPELHLKAMYCSRLDGHGTTTVISNRVCTLTDRYRENLCLVKMAGAKEGLYMVSDTPTKSTLKAFAFRDDDDITSNLSENKTLQGKSVMQMKE